MTGVSHQCPAILYFSKLSKTKQELPEQSHWHIWGTAKVKGKVQVQMRERKRTGESGDSD
jgi:hypothetical protein